MRRTDIKSHCPINFALEVVGDPWSLLIVRDIVYFGKKTYGEFLESDERIATNVLACRLADLEHRGILQKHPHDFDKRKEVYVLTDRGLDLIPILLDLACWGACHDVETQAPANWITAVRQHRQEIIEYTRKTVRNGGSIFVGPGCVASKFAPAA